MKTWDILRLCAAKAEYRQFNRVCPLSQVAEPGQCAIKEHYRTYPRQLPVSSLRMMSAQNPRRFDRLTLVTWFASFRGHSRFMVPASNKSSDRAALDSSVSVPDRYPGGAG